MLLASLAGLTVGVAYADLWRRRPRRLWPTLAVVVVSAAVSVAISGAVSPPGLETKGPVEEGVAVVLCYLAMLSGMAAQYAYAQAERGRRRLKWEPLAFLMPVFASPIVFIPLLTIMTDIQLGGAFTKAKLMVYLVAFQNGFFWKGFFERQRETAAEPARTPASRADR
jgi:drug/metabolite transporter (DMT)-like permease